MHSPARSVKPPGIHALLTEPTSAQRQAFELIGTAIPLSLK